MDIHGHLWSAGAHWVGVYNAKRHVQKSLKQKCYYIGNVNSKVPYLQVLIYSIYIYDGMMMVGFGKWKVCFKSVIMQL